MKNLILKRQSKRFLMKPQYVYFALSIGLLHIGFAYSAEVKLPAMTTAATGPLIGHAPGIRTVVTVDNPDGELRVCSEAKINYQILDMDGDWDRAFTSNNKEGTQNSIKWWFQPQDSNKKILVAKQSLGINIHSEIDQTVIIVPKYIEDELTGEIHETLGGELSFEIRPYTGLATLPDTSNTSLKVEDLTKAYYLKMAEVPGLDVEQDTLALDISFITSVLIMPHQNPLAPTLSLPGLHLNQNSSFIKTVKILPTVDEDCDSKTVFEAEIVDAKGNPIEDNFTVDSQYIANIKINGRQLKEVDLIDKDLVWRLFKPVNREQCDIYNLDDRNNEMCFITESYSQHDHFGNGEKRVNHYFNEQGELLYSEFFTQHQNSDASEKLQNTQPNFSEQGYFVGVSLISKS